MDEHTFILLCKSDLLYGTTLCETEAFLLSLSAEITFPLVTPLQISYAYFQCDF